MVKGKEQSYDVLKILTVMTLANVPRLCSVSGDVRGAAHPRDNRSLNSIQAKDSLIHLGTHLALRCLQGSSAPRRSPRGRMGPPGFSCQQTSHAAQPQGGSPPCTHAPSQYPRAGKPERDMWIRPCRNLQWNFKKSCALGMGSVQLLITG